MGSYAHVAVLIPCRNEEPTIAKVVADHLRELPGARVYVFDNGSTDRSAELSARAGATVIPSPRPGKGHVVRHMFATVEAERYLIVDGDDTYPAAAAPALLSALDGEADDIAMAVGARHHSGRRAFRRGHRAGNFVISRLIALLFDAPITDALSGQRALRRTFVKRLSLRAAGFEVETELTLTALAEQRAIREIPITYRARPAGSASKLHTLRDGLLILRTILRAASQRRYSS